MDSLPGFPTIDSENVDNFENLKKSNKSKKGGGFQSMGLSYGVLKGITKRGYKIPTPIQRKTIPLILEGRDVVAMAKTGSGKTACFLIPMFEKLKQRVPNKGARALIMSPTRELAIQTYKFIKDIGKFLDFKSILVLGGDSMDSQFSAIHTCPDIIIATPGRFLHLCVEMDLKLNSIEYVVFDEADRLFEMGFGEQLNEITNRLPSAKQLVLFSATLPKLLVNFAKVGLSDPILIRLDVDSKLPEELMLKFLHCRSDERYSTLVVLLKYIIPSDAQTVVFVGTKHHVELISSILTEFGITNTSIYSKLDPAARKINTAKFVLKKVSVLIVTDVAARGIDVPSLDYVVNVHFPGKPKLFVHRVGRCARAGRQGTAYSLFCPDDEAHLLDLHLFLNKPFDIGDNNSIGIVPQDLLEEEHLAVSKLVKSDDIASVYRISENAYKKYLNTRPHASVDSNKRAKTIKFFALKQLEEFRKVNNANNQQEIDDKEQTNKEIEERKLIDGKHEMLLKMRTYRPSGTIFELNCQRKSLPYEIMKEKRSKHKDVIQKFYTKMIDVDQQENDRLQRSLKSKNNNLPAPNEVDIKATFDQVISSKKRKNLEDITKEKNKKVKPTKDTENYIPYEATDKHTESGFAINSFQREAAKAEFSVVNSEEITYRPGMKKWDKVKKKMVPVQDPRAGKIRTESGAWISSSFKTGRYNVWKEKTKIEEQIQRDNDDDDNDANNVPLSHEKRYPIGRHARHNAKIETKKRMGNIKVRNGRYKSELKNPDQIVKERIRIETAKNREKINKTKKDERRKKHMKKHKQKGRKARR